MHGAVCTECAIVVKQPFISLLSTKGEGFATVSHEAELTRLRAEVGFRVVP